MGAKTLTTLMLTVAPLTMQLSSAPHFGHTTSESVPLFDLETCRPHTGQEITILSGIFLFYDLLLIHHPRHLHQILPIARHFQTAHKGGTGNGLYHFFITPP